MNTRNKYPNKLAKQLKDLGVDIEAEQQNSEAGRTTQISQGETLPSTLSHNQLERTEEGLPKETYAQDSKLVR